MATRVHGIVKHDHELPDGTTRTHSHVNPHLQHVWWSLKRKRQEIDAGAPDSGTRDVRPYDDPYVNVDSNMWTSDPYGTAMAAIGAALNRSLGDSGMMNEYEYLTLLDIAKTVHQRDSACLTDFVIMRIADHIT